MKLERDVIDMQARSVLNILQSMNFEVDDHRAYGDTFVLYNGRERWGGMMFSTDFLSPNLFIIFGEHRNSDQLCVQHWTGERNLNPPTLKDIPEDSYAEREFFQFMNLESVVKRIQKLINDHVLIMRDHRKVKEEE